MADSVEELSRAINRLIEEGRIKPGERRPCLTLELSDLEDADKVAEVALIKARCDAKSGDS